MKIHVLRYLLPQAYGKRIDYKSSASSGLPCSQLLIRLATVLLSSPRTASNHLSNPHLHTIFFAPVPAH